MTHEEAIQALIHASIEGTIWFSNVRNGQEPAIMMAVKDGVTIELLHSLQEVLGGRIRPSYNHNENLHWSISGEEAYIIGKELYPILWKLQRKGDVSYKLVALGDVLYRWRNRQCA